MLSALQVHMYLELREVREGACLIMIWMIMIWMIMIWMIT